MDLVSINGRLDGILYELSQMCRRDVPLQYDIRMVMSDYRGIRNIVSYGDLPGVYVISVFPDGGGEFASRFAEVYGGVLAGRRPSVGWEGQERNGLLPLYVGRSVKVAGSLYKHFDMPNESRGYGMRLSRDANLRKFMYRVEIFTMADTKHYKMIGGYVEDEIEKIYRPMIGR